MSGEDTPRASTHPRERLLDLIGDPVVPPQWRGRAIGLCGEFDDSPSDDAIARARDLIAAAELFGDLWSHFCRVERIVHAARSEPSRPDWRDDAHEVLDLLTRGATS